MVIAVYTASFKTSRCLYLNFKRRWRMHNTVYLHQPEKNKAVTEYMNKTKNFIGQGSGFHTCLLQSSELSCTTALLPNQGCRSFSLQVKSVLLPVCPICHCQSFLQSALHWVSDHLWGNPKYLRTARQNPLFFRPNPSLFSNFLNFGSTPIIQYFLVQCDVLSSGICSYNYNTSAFPPINTFRCIAGVDQGEEGVY